VWDPWCSSGGLAADGTLVSTGGWLRGSRTVRFMRPCNDCDWKEFQTALADSRWYVYACFHKIIKIKDIFSNEKGPTYK
jgi:hypothetical protein